MSDARRICPACDAGDPTSVIPFKDCECNPAPAVHSAAHQIVTNQFRCSACGREGETIHFLHRTGCSGRTLSNASATTRIVPVAMRYRCTGRYAGGQEACDYATPDLIKALSHHEVTDHDMELQS